MQAIAVNGDITKLETDILVTGVTFLRVGVSEYQWNGAVDNAIRRSLSGDYHTRLAQALADRIERQPVQEGDTFFVPTALTDAGGVVVDGQGNVPELNQAADPADGFLSVVREFNQGVCLVGGVMFVIDNLIGPLEDVVFAALTAAFAEPSVTRVSLPLMRTGRMLGHGPDPDPIQSLGEGVQRFMRSNPNRDGQIMVVQYLPPAMIARYVGPKITPELGQLLRILQG